MSKMSCHGKHGMAERLNDPEGLSYDEATENYLIPHKIS